MVEDKVELIPLFPKFKCTDKFGRKWLLFVPGEMETPPNEPLLVRALVEILETPPLGLKQVEDGKIWFSPNHHVAYRFGYLDEPIKRYERKK